MCALAEKLGTEDGLLIPLQKQPRWLQKVVRSAQRNGGIPPPRLHLSRASLQTPTPAIEAP